ncbi:M56 family metallopeptidase [Algibacter pectinivorans]|uniref:Signal transducer regulating beta-lactamase production, contains metallopeptidase domain n=1 Tax=Algibacter pectinivorans TaxID=870482 RepID=A0A1I1MJT4_9FLAO|nr:M56 family metallopeptidase [Algibacter pectinivorans]SFC85375.1 Signal transducer regulating beta-lactamase production, contains metallopeptidase domain [Algibacter pectinivorans]
MLHYIIQVVAFQLFFLIIYDLFLKKETFFNWNRAYLLITAIMPLILPFIKVPSFKNILSQDYIINLPEIFIGSASQHPVNPIPLEGIILKQQSFWSWELLFYLGTGIATCIFIFKLIKLLKLLFKNPKCKYGNVFIVSVLKSDMAFSFFNYIFLGALLNKTNRDTVLKHEMVHVKQKHTLDLLFFELLRIAFWFNPLTYIYQNRIMSLHEYIADAQVVKNQNKNQYYQNLLSQVFDTKNISFINPFFKQSLIKKRIIMLQKSKSKQVKLFKYALLIPMLIAMLVYTSCMETNPATTIGNTSNEEIQQKTPLITKVKALKHQIEIQGDVNEAEERGLKLLLDAVKGEGFNQALVKDIQDYTTKGSQTDLTKKIAEVFKQIQVQGDINENEDLEIKKLLVFTSDNGFEDPFFADIIKHLDVPFGIIDQVPVFPGCEDLTVEEQKKCMSKNIAMHINKNFNTKLADSLNLKGKQRINVIFKISVDGDVVGVRSRSEHPELEKEAIRVVKTLPRFKPGEHKGKQVNVPYSLPIIFQGSDVQNKKEDTVLLNEVPLNKDVAIAHLDEVPNFESCDNALSNEEKKACLDKGITTHVSKHFNTKLAHKLGLNGKQRIHVIFKIDEHGRVIDIRSRAAHPELEAEAIRVVKLLPKMIPGKVDGKQVVVPYSLPIIFQV